MILRGLSSAGRAPDLHSGGQRFDPARLHQVLWRMKEVQEFPDLVSGMFVNREGKTDPARIAARLEFIRVW